MAELGNRTPIIDWRDGVYVEPGVNLYPLLFADPLDGDPAVHDTAVDVSPPLWAGRLAAQPRQIIAEAYPRSHSSPFIYRKLSTDLRCDPAAAVAVFWSYLPKTRRLAARLRRDPRFAGKAIDDLVTERLTRHFTPTGPVLPAVDALFEGRKRPVIGVHIRYTDSKSPLPRIEAELRALRRRLPDSDIFLATDNGTVQDRIMARFDRVFVIEKSLDSEGQALHVAAQSFADPLQEARNALIDMWALSRCDWLIHSRHSTFSVAAALIGGIPAARQIDVNRANLRIVAKRWFQEYA